jgi:hypothetical protein
VNFINTVPKPEQDYIPILVRQKKKINKTNAIKCGKRQKINVVGVRFP